MFWFHKRFEKVMFFIDFSVIEKYNEEKNEQNCKKKELLNSLEENDDVEKQGHNETNINVNSF